MGETFIKKAILMDLRPLAITDIPAWGDLLALCFNQSILHMQQLIEWLYCLGQLEAYGLWENDQLIAQYSCLQRTISFNSLVIPLGMSMNMAVHPDYRGKGLIKQVSQPVYEGLRQQQVEFGMGFSNAQGVKVDKHSKSYGYQVIGQMQPYIIKVHNFKRPPLKPLDRLPNPFHVPPNHSFLDAHFSKDTNHLIRRYLQHPFRQYEYGIWCEHNEIQGIVVYKTVNLKGFPSVALLDVYSQQPEELLMRWSSTLHHNHIYFIHMLVSPNSRVKQIIKRHFLTIRAPHTYNPYYLTIKPLTDYFDKTLLDFARWDLIGGDIL